MPARDASGRFVSGAGFTGTGTGSGTAGGARGRFSSSGDRLEVVGLRDLQRELRALDKTMPRELRKTNLEAAELVATATRQSFAGRPGVAPKVAASVKALAQQRNASVRIGGAQFPYAMGSNFGSWRYLQFPPPTEPDYSLFASIRDHRREVLLTYEAALDKLTKKAFPN